MFFYRLNPQNGHQLPTIVVLCGPHFQGAQGLNCARHLVNHGVKTIVFLPNFIRMVQSVEQELKLYEMCGGKRYSNVQGSAIFLCYNLPKIKTKKSTLRVFRQQYANGIANSVNPDQTAP